MAVAAALVEKRRAKPVSFAEAGPSAAWSWADTLCALGWLLVALLARGFLTARIEGLLDHDQGVVGLMALDISHGSRWPIFFDGQRYMGALEAYTAALFVALFGHSPAVVSMAPTLYTGLFVAGQFALWRKWAGRATGHLAALVAAVGSPMLALWGVAPRGGYSEVLAWALPVLAVYRWSIRPLPRPMTKRAQVGWGFLFAFGIFLNPLSLVVYAAIGFDWLFGRHGADLRKARHLAGGWVDSPRAALVWAGLAVLALGAIAAACHVELDRARNQIRYVWLLDMVPEKLGVVIGPIVLVLLLGFLGWWTGVARRLFLLLAGRPWFGLGAIGALCPFAINSLRVALGITENGFSLPIWIRAPWDIAPNLRDGIYALRPLVGCDPKAAAYSIIGLSLHVPPSRWPGLEHALEAATPWLIGVAALLVATVAWRDRGAWRSFFALEGEKPTPPTVLALAGLVCCFTLYLLQATSPNSTSIRYLLPAWIFLPGLLAQGLLIWPRPARIAAAVMLLTLWAASQVLLWVDMDRPSPMRSVARELEQRGVHGFVAATPLVLILSDISQGRLGGREYHSYWPRVSHRYDNRFLDGEPIMCVN
ncbi:MAG TPA: hypothetical protein VGY53_05050, partial [Isosphaeraceae bacterium]|nr:hypothetical protein [Isosphaeraceae bacterium]